MTSTTTPKTSDTYGDLLFGFWVSLFWALILVGYFEGRHVHHGLVARWHGYVEPIVGGLWFPAQIIGAVGGTIALGAIVFYLWKRRKGNISKEVVGRYRSIVAFGIVFAAPFLIAVVLRVIDGDWLIIKGAV